MKYVRLKTKSVVSAWSEKVFVFPFNVHPAS